MTHESERRTPSKRVRFEVFKRDHFTCQYCGAQPPDVVLVIDHIEPFAQGGLTTPDNLVTACQPCNAGKSDRRIETRIARPDADLLYLETQQEIAEIHRYQEALADKEDALSGLIADLQGMWEECTGQDWSPASHIVRRLLHRYPFEVVHDSMENVALKVAGRYGNLHKRDQWLPYLYSVARNMAIELGEIEEEED